MAGRNAGVAGTAQATEGDTLGVLLQRELPFAFPSRGLTKKILKHGRVAVDGEICHDERKQLRGGAIVEYLHSAPARCHSAKATARTVPPAFQPVWAYIDDWCAVLVKPTHMSVQGDDSADVLHHAVACSMPPAEGLPDALAKPRPAHRIDKMTGGLLVFARCSSAASAISAAFEAHQVQKTYLAIVAGKLEGEGYVDTPVHGKPARSRWTSLSCTRSAASGWITTLRLHPETGRHHQLRRHLALSLGCPILGDPKYTNAESRAADMDEMYLFAASIALPHPARAEQLVVDAKEPAYFAHRRSAEEAAATKADPAVWRAAVARMVERQAAAAASTSGAGDGG